MAVFEIDPLGDPRWPEFLERSPRASVFHTPAWLKSLKCTYGYEPVVYTTCTPGSELTNGWLFCQVRSWLTGSRLVSLPFSDHCDPLVDKTEQLDELAQTLQLNRERRGWNCIEYRPLTPTAMVDGFESFETFCFHKLDLRHNLEELFRGLHRSSTQRKIRRAEREGVICEEGHSEPLLDQFYRLLVLTRRRHMMLPQPRKWFSSLARCMGDRLKVRVAFSHGIPVASILTLRYKSTLVYKYGCANERFFRLGGVQMLLWRAIKEGKENCLREFDLGRSESHNPGLIMFKDRLGATRTTLSYSRHPIGLRPACSIPPATQQGKKLFSYLPGCILTTGGKLLYKHFG